jgi:hypothetical protein
VCCIEKKADNGQQEIVKESEKSPQDCANGQIALENKYVYGRTGC